MTSVEGRLLGNTNILSMKIEETYGACFEFDITKINFSPFH